MQRLEIVWRPSVLGTSPPLTDEAGYWTLAVESTEDELYLRATGFTDEGDGIGEHVVPWVLVRSASTRPYDEPF